jgi:hypothetical protein
MKNLAHVPENVRSAGFSCRALICLRLIQRLFEHVLLIGGIVFDGKIE